MENIQIPEGLPRFKDEKTIIVVCGGLEARVFSGLNGVLAEIAHVRAPEIHYSDNEMRFTKNAGGHALGMGSVRDAVEEKEETEFFTEFKKAMAGAVKEGSPENIYLFVPKYAAAQTLAGLPKPFDESAIVVAHGNYLDKSPVEILELMTEIKA